MAKCTLAAIRDECNALLEVARTSGRLGASLEADVLITVPLFTSTSTSTSTSMAANAQAQESLLASLSEFEADLPEVLLVSGVDVVSQGGRGGYSAGRSGEVSILGEVETEVAVPASETGKQKAVVHLAIIPASGKKCRRCWKHTAPTEDQVCGRCEAVLAQTA